MSSEYLVMDLVWDASPQLLGNVSLHQKIRRLDRISRWQMFICYDFTFTPVLSYFIACAFLLYVMVRTTRTQMLALFAYALAYALCWSIDHLINAML